MSDGDIRDPLTGQYTKKVLTSEQASAMGKRRAEKQGDAAKQRAEQLLLDRGIDPENADEGMRTLAELAIGGRTGAVTALRYLDMVTGHFEPEQVDSHRVDFVLGDKIAMIDGQYFMQITGEQVAQFSEAVIGLIEGNDKKRYRERVRTPQNHAQRGSDD